MKRRKFADGGTLDPEVAAEADAQLSFGDAFKAARGHGLKTFEYKGKKYTTETAAEKARATPRRTPTEAPKLTTSLPKVSVTGKRPSTVSGAFPQNQDDVKRPSIYDSPEKWKAYREGKPAPTETPRRKFDMDTSAQVDYLQGMKKGGGVKKYARGGGIEAKGKTRGKIC